MVAKAKAKYVRVSPSKVRRHLNLIKGKPFQDAVNILEFQPSPTAAKVLKVLNSAGANAEENHNMAKDDLFVLQAIADDGPTIKRFRPRALGRAYRINKRTSHITVELTDELPKRK